MSFKDIKSLKIKLNDLNNIENVFEILSNLNNILLEDNLSIKDKKFFIDKYNEIILFIENDNNLKNNLDYLNYKTFYYYIYNKPKRLLNQINSKNLFDNTDTLVLLLDLFIKNNYDNEFIFEYYDIIMKNWLNTISKNIKKIFDNNIINSNVFKYIDYPKEFYRISRFSNLESIIELWLLSRNLADKKINYNNNSYLKIQERRDDLWKYNLHDYVPLFFLYIQQWFILLK